MTALAIRSSKQGKYAWKKGNGGESPLARFRLKGRRADSPLHLAKKEQTNDIMKITLKKKLTMIAAIGSSVFLLAACEPGEDRGTGVGTGTGDTGMGTQDDAQTYGQRDRDIGTTQEPATTYQEPATTYEAPATTTQDPAMQDQPTGAGTGTGTGAGDDTDTAF
jgi:hypothetical protein